MRRPGEREGGRAALENRERRTERPCGATGEGVFRKNIETQGMGTVERPEGPNGEVPRPLRSFCVFVENFRQRKSRRWERRAEADLRRWPGWARAWAAAWKRGRGWRWAR